MSGSIKCTYEDCFKHFKGEDAMKKHKHKDPDHFYCKRCDVDCEDDMSLLIHQIESSKHIACPKCGEEFNGFSARDLHVDLHHKGKQILLCVGCDMKLPGAAAYMRHIVNNECDVITLEHFNQLRAEKQIQKDDWEAALDTNNVVYGDLSRLASDADTNGGAPLMDDEPRGRTNGNLNTSELVSRISPLQPTSNNSQQSTTKLTSSMANLSVDRYPPLPVGPQASQEAGKKQIVRPKPTVEHGDLLEFNDAKVRDNAVPKQQQQKRGQEVTVGTASSTLFAPKEDKAYPSQSDLSGYPGAIMKTTITGATYGNDTQVNDSADPKDHTPLPATAKPVKNDPNAPLAGIRSAPKKIPQSILEPMNFYNEISNKFECSGRGCEGSFDTAEEFKDHLRTGTHVGGKIRCPSCFKRFLNTWALIAHCESASRKCRISKTAQYNQVLRDLTAGLLGTEGHMDDNSDVRYVAVLVENWVEEQKDTYW